MKRYLLFAGVQYYPDGGWKDFVGAFSSIEEIKQNYPLKSFDWFHVVDLENETIVDWSGKIINYDMEEFYKK